MVKDRSAEDTISEKDYTMRMKSVSTNPQDDSPGDSEMDAGIEFGMGLEYLPNEKNDPVMPDEELSADEPDEQKPKERVSKKSTFDEIQIPETAKVISSDQPAPWLDRDNSSSTN